MSFFAIPVSGLLASQDELTSVSNNLANLDTIGYKDQNVSFADVFAQGNISGSVTPVQTGLGVQVEGSTSDFSNGTTTATNVSSNMALTGAGFFVTKQADGSTDYTRAGNFVTNTSGQLTDPNGNLVLGYPAVGGVVQTSGGLQPLEVGAGLIAPAVATTSFGVTANLSSTAAVGDTASSPIQVYDSLGNAHTLTIDYTNTAPNTWSYSINVPTTDTGAGSSVIASGTLNFSSSGQLTSPTGSVTGISIPSLTDGAAPMTLSWNLNGTGGGPSVTQINVASSTSATTQNGFAGGSLSSYSIGTDGTIEGLFSNGQTLALGQVAVASFTNVQGLTRVGNNNYQASNESGPVQVGVAGTDGRGTILGGYTEGSNVDVATEFAKMIVAQQAYQSNAKVVTTFDQVSQATIAMVSS
jgi:flagellar hook protein FlgE